MLAMLSTRPVVRCCALTSAVALALLGTSLPRAGLPATAAAAGRQPDLSRFYRQKVAWTACEGADMPKDLQCGEVTVPLDYAKPGAGTLDLALARYRATGPSRGSVLLNFGGPGGPGVSELAADGKDFMDLTNGYDVVSFDPRGVGRSSPVSCGDDSKQISPATRKEADAAHPTALLSQLQKVATECVKHSGPVLQHIGTVNASRDLDVMRQALGDKKLNYLGFSYGTRLGAVYAKQFPHNVGRLVLDGVDTLTEPLTEQGVVSVEGQQRALDDFLDWCVQDIACPFGQDRRSADDQVLKLVDSLDKDPVPTGFGAELTGQDLVGTIGQALYSKAMWTSLEQAISSLVNDGDTRGVETITGGGALPGAHRTGSRSGSARPGRKHDGGLVDESDIPPDNPSAALMAIDCADDPDRPGSAQMTKELGGLLGEYQQASPVFGRYRLTQLLMCYGRPKGTDYIRNKVKNVDTPSMLLVGTRGDPATPYRWAVETARRLGSSAVVLDNEGDGHTGYNTSKCVHGKVDDFLLYGSLPSNGSSCSPDQPNTPGGTLS